ncbi:hypothetical protein EJ04DRAFT_367182 [Polyplosphaeria fusca]|uniref:Uncharacterized protein n=1 Tax=Polyplosphaeria fusca TaxID=682080 RepID=A0A9P4QPW0_9PLEO|nr:hypothetical protein EJ04DRAFT_367182 [Polyplosphaeria fusca]
MRIVKRAIGCPSSCSAPALANARCHGIWRQGCISGAAGLHCAVDGGATSHGRALLSLSERKKVRELKGPRRQATRQAPLESEWVAGTGGCVVALYSCSVAL